MLQIKALDVVSYEFNDWTSSLMNLNNKNLNFIIGWAFFIEIKTYSHPQSVLL